MNMAFAFKRPGRWLARSFLLAGLIAAGIVYWQSKTLIAHELNSQLDIRAQEAKYSVEREVDRYAEVLHGLQAQLIMNPDLSRRTFQRIAQSLHLDKRLPGIQAVAFTQRIEAGAGGTFEETVRHELTKDNVGYPPPVIHPQTPTGETFVVQYVDPIGDNYAGAWFDQGSEPKRRAAIERARDTGELSTSGRVRLMVRPAHFAGVLFFLPVYRSGVVPTTLEARRQQFLGAVFLVIRVDEMLRHIFGPELLNDLDIEIYDMQESRQSRMGHGMDNLIFDSGSYRQVTGLHSHNSAFPLQRLLTLQDGGSLWHINVTALPQFMSRSQHWLPLTAAAVVALLSLCLFYFLRALELSRNALHARAQAVEVTAHLRERAMEACANAIIITSAQAPEYPIEYVNSAFERMTGYSAEEVIGRGLRLLRQDDRLQPGLQQLRALVREQREGHAVVHSYRKDGTPYWSEVHVAPVRDDAGKVSHFVAVEYDVTATKKYEAELEFQANRDSLTGLANRNLLRDRLSQALAYADRYNHPVWVVFIDLDRFKFVVDTLGLAAGDVLLKKTAERIQSAVRETDTVARMAGDEFVLVLPEQIDEYLSSVVVQRIIDTVIQPLIIEGHEIVPSCSVGVAVYPTDGCDADTLIKYAGIAAYRAKELGRNQLQFYTPTLNERALERLRIESDLRGALERNEFLLFYQPQVDLHTGHIVGMEALIRWQHPDMGLVLPGRFIGLAEDNGMIVPIGEWVLRTACMQNKAWQRAGLGHLRVAVNLSVRQFAQQNLVQSIAAVLEESGLEPRYLDIELTESLVMADVEQAVGTLCGLKKLGVHLSVDDFGTGYSSLSYLKRFPIDMLKIDQSFVRDITTDPDDAAISRSVISMAHSLRLQVVAEGVETQAQLAYLRRHACDQIQGYIFSAPVPAKAFEQLLQERKCLPDVSGSGIMPRQTLLIVDDEANVTASLQRLLHQDGYHILKASTCAEAFELLALHCVQVIICDLRMPVMSGAEFLSKVKEMYPATIRIMLSGYTGLDSVIDTINRGAIHRFFTKPWDNEVLRANIREAFRHYWLLQGSRAVQDAEVTQA